LENESRITIDCDLEMKYLCQLSNTSQFSSQRHISLNGFFWPKGYL